MNQSDQIIDALMRLLAERTFDRISIQAIADEAGVDLATLNAAFASRGAILEAFVRRIDQDVLAGRYDDMADEPPRERLFDVLMARLDALRPYRGALKSLLASVRRDPAMGVELNRWIVRSNVWMLAAAGVDASGLRGSVAAQALTLSYLRVLQTFVKEEDPGLPRTMAMLDQELRKAEQRHNRIARWLGPAVRGQTAPAAGAAAANGEPGAATEMAHGAAEWPAHGAAEGPMDDPADAPSFAADPPGGDRVDAVSDGALESDTFDAPSDRIPPAEAEDAAQAAAGGAPTPAQPSPDDGPRV